MAEINVDAAWKTRFDAVKAMRAILQSWLDRKLDRYRFLKEPRRGAKAWKCMAARLHYAGVVISATPAREFSFLSRANWPSAYREIGETAVLDGILDTLSSFPKGKKGVRAE